MLAHPTLDKLNAMGLAGMAKAFGELVANGEAEHLSHAEWLGLLLEREWSSRYDRKLAARLRFAKLRHQATPEDVDYRADRGLDRALFMKLLGGDWINAHDNLAICGPSGVAGLSGENSCIAEDHLVWDGPGFWSAWIDLRRLVDFGDAFALEQALGDEVGEAQDR